MGRTIDELYPFSAYALLRREVLRVSQELRQLQSPNSPSGTHYTVKLSDEFCFAMNTKLEIQFLSSFNGYFYISTRKDAKGLWLSIHANDILFFSPKIPLRVHPVRVAK